MKFLTIQEDGKAKMKINIIRFLVLLTYIFAGVFLAENQYLSMNGVIGSSTFMFYVTIFIYGAFTWLLFWLVSSFSYNFFSRSKYVPVNSEGICKVNKPTYIAGLSLFVAIKNLIIGGLNFVMYEYTITFAIGIALIPVILKLIILFFFFLLLKGFCGKGEGKQVLLSYTTPGILMLLLL